MAAYIFVANFIDGSPVEPAGNQIVVTDEGVDFLLEVLATATPESAARAFFDNSYPDANGDRHGLVRYGPRRYGIEVA